MFRTLMNAVTRVAMLVGLLILSVGNHSPVVGASPPATNPILVVIDPSAANPFGAYLGEILRAEGITSFQSAARADISSQYLASFPIVVLAEMTLTAPEATILSNYVSGGGCLLAMRPDPRLAPVFGLTATAGTTAAAYILVNTDHPVGVGIAGQTMQTHSVADHYTVGSASVVATVYAGASVPTAYPAVVVNNYGAGRAAAFTYDLARAVAYLRQGNPTTAGTDADGDGIVRTTDGFYHWIDLERMQIPQADEQQRLLANLITHFGKQTIPIPRIWYFPKANQKVLLVVTGDDHGASTEVFGQLATIAESHGGRMSFYVAPGVALPYGLDPAALKAWQSKGHEFGMHPVGQQAGKTLDEAYAIDRDWFNSNYGVSPSATVRNHNVEWLGWVEAAKVAQKYGIRMDLSYYHWGAWLQKPSGDWIATGFLTGSGLPMKLVDQSGAIVPVYQQHTQLVDEHLIAGAGEGWAGLSSGEATAVAQQLIAEAVAGNYAAITVQSQTSFGTNEWLDGVTAYAQSQGVPIWTAARWLAFTETRHDAVIEQLTWNPTTRKLSFGFSTTSSEPVTTLLVPTDYLTFSVRSVAVDDVPIPTGLLRAKGVVYNTIPVGSGAHTVVVTYTQPERVFLPAVTRDYDPIRRVYLPATMR